MNISKKSELLVVGIISLFFVYIYWRFQPQINAGEGRGWDGKSYYDLYRYFSESLNETSVLYPFCKRIGLPYLAALLPLDSRHAFLLINLTFGYLSILVCFIALRVRYEFSISLFAVVPLCTYLFSPIRFANFYPYYVDPAAILMFALSFLALIHRRYFLSIFFILVSAFFRESGLYYAIGLTAILYFRKQIPLQILLTSIGSIALSSVTLRALQVGTCDGSQIYIILRTLLSKFGSFTGVLNICAGLLMTLGAFILSGRKIRRDMMDPYFIVALGFLLLTIAMSSAGGFDTTRIFFSAYPLYLYFLAFQIENQPKLKVIYFSLCGLIVNSFMRIIPEPASYWPNNEISGFFAVFPDYAHIAISTSIIAYWLVCVYIGEQIHWTNEEAPKS